MKRLIITALGIAAIAFPATVLAASQVNPTNCSIPNDASRVYLWENTIADTGGGNDYLVDCLNEDMTDLPHNPDGVCKGRPRIFDDWADCTSSLTPWIPSGWKLCLYTGFNWQNPVISIGSAWNGQRRDFGPNAGQYHFPGDALRSYRFVLSSQPCYEG